MKPNLLTIPSSVQTVNSDYIGVTYTFFFLKKNPKHLLACLDIAVVGKKPSAT